MASWSFSLSFRGRDINDRPNNNVLWSTILDRTILDTCTVRQLRNIRVCMVSSQQKLRFISKQNNFQTEKVYTFAMTTSIVKKKRRWGGYCGEWHICYQAEVKMKYEEWILLHFKWENESEKRTCELGESLIKWVKWLLLSALTTRTLLLALADACDMINDAMNISSNLTWWFHLLPTTPSVRRLGDFEVAMKQSRYDMMKDSSIEIRFGTMH